MCCGIFNTARVSLSLLISANTSRDIFTQLPARIPFLARCRNFLAVTSRSSRKRVINDIRCVKKLRFQTCLSVLRTIVCNKSTCALHICRVNPICRAAECFQRDLGRDFATRKNAINGWRLRSRAEESATITSQRVTRIPINPTRPSRGLGRPA